MAVVAALKTCRGQRNQCNSLRDAPLEHIPERPVQPAYVHQHILGTQPEAHGWARATVDRSVDPLEAPVGIVDGMERHGRTDDGSKRCHDAMILRGLQFDFSGLDHRLCLVEVLGNALEHGSDARGVQNWPRNLVDGCK